MKKGTIREGVLTCAWHKWEFDLETGGCYRGACDDLPVYETKIEAGIIYVKKEPTSPDSEKNLRQLAEAMMVGDSWLQAKALARLFKEKVALKKIIHRAIEQGFLHSTRAHQTEAAVTEMQTILDSGELAAFFPDRDKIGVLLHGTKISSGNSGFRPQVFPLPAIHREPPKLENLIYRYSFDSSPLAIERLLLSCFQSGLEERAHMAVLETSLSPFFFNHKRVFRSVVAILRCDTYLREPDFQKIKAALLSWVLGKSRNAPDPDTRDAINWIEQHQERLQQINFHSAQKIEELDLKEILRGENVAVIFDRLLTRLEQGGSFASFLNAFSLLSARRFESLSLNNGGLWNKATEGIRLCNCIRQIIPQSTAQIQLRSLFMLAFYFFESRWLKFGEHPKVNPDLKDGSWQDFQSSFLSFQLTPARNQAISLLRQANRKDLKTMVPNLCGNLVKNDLTATQLDSLLAVLQEQQYQQQWEPYFNGLITYFLDQKLTQQGESAAQFGRSFL